MEDQPLDEYNQALDAIIDQETGPEGAEDIGAPTLEPADALDIGKAPSAQTQVLLDQHPEIHPDYEDAVQERLVLQGAYPPTTDSRHTTYPFLTLYERTKVLALRASQLAHGAPPFIEVPDYLTDVYEIAKAELDAKRLPFILKRPLPDGTYEYWRLADLMLI